MRRLGFWICLLAVTLILWPYRMASQTHRVELDNGWAFHALNAPESKSSEQWMPASVPGVVQTDLLRNGVISDPFIGDNEKSLQWIATTDWEYREEFAVDPTTLRRRHAELVFDGLDTLADVWLNDRPLLQANNMFRSWHVDVTGRLQNRNTLRILFHSPVNTVAAMAAKLPYIVPGTGYEPLDRSKGIYPTSQYVRKAGYSFGWDWAPRLVTAGVWRPVHLDSWDRLRITTLHLHQELVNSARAVAQVEVNAESEEFEHGTLLISVVAPSGNALPPIQVRVTLDKGVNHFIVPLRIVHPRLWYPNGYGPQDLYTIKANLVVSPDARDSRVLQTGLRSLELRREPDAWGKSFAFVVNDVPIFIKGANFIPLDSFPPAVTPERRLKVLTAARDAHMNMLRVWGGGYYEADDFYEDADRLGLLIWHDFMFGGSMIPHDSAYLDNVRQESREQVERLSDHPSIALWCGNNEVETAWKGWDDHQRFKAGLTPEQREQVWQDYLLVFYDILKSAVAKYGNSVPYWPSSPSADFDDSAGSMLNGDAHSWRVWSAGAPVTEYANSTPRFLSEFGFQSMPDLRTVRAFAGANEDLASPAILDHERFLGGFGRMQQYLGQEFKKPRDFHAVDYLSQVEQAEAIKFGVETMRSRRPQNMGTLFWQLDDCWPAVSWSSIDYYLHPKALQFYARRFYAPLLIAATFDKGIVNLSIVSDETASRSAALHWRLLSADGVVLIEGDKQISIPALASNVIQSLNLKEVNGFDPRRDVLAVSLLDEGGKQLATQNLYFTTTKDLALPQEQVVASLKRASGDFILTLHAAKLVRVVELSFGNADVKLDDNFFDLLPGETRNVVVHTSQTLEELRSALRVDSIESATR